VCKARLKIAGFFFAFISGFGSGFASVFTAIFFDIWRGLTKALSLCGCFWVLVLNPKKEKSLNVQCAHKT